MSDQHLAPVCPHCGKPDCINTPGFPQRSWYALPCSGPEDDPDCQECQEKAEGYLTEIKRLEIELDREKRAGNTEELIANGEYRDKVRWRKRARKWKRIARKNNNCTGADDGIPCAGELAYQVERKRARKWKRRAERSDGFAAYWEKAFIDGDAKHRDNERHLARDLDEARAEAEAQRYQAEGERLRAEQALQAAREAESELDAMTARARGMREALETAIDSMIERDNGMTHDAWVEVIELCQRAAGEPIP